MSQKLLFFIFLTFLGISLQFDCEDFSDLTSEGHNGKYNLNCNNDCLKSEGNIASYHCYWFDAGKTK